jgi:hypothetical protein
MIPESREMSDAPIGQRFSQAYLKSGEPTRDSERMRRRLGALLGTLLDVKVEELSSAVTLKLGIDVPWYGGRPNFVALFQHASIQDVLDLVTIVYQYLEAKRRGPMYEPGASNSWRLGAQRIFQEESVHYRVDERGGVHFSFDAEFDRGMAATIAALQNSRYRAALSSFDGAMAALGKRSARRKSSHPRHLRCGGRTIQVDVRQFASTDGSGGVETGAAAAENSRDGLRCYGGRDQTP